MQALLVTQIILVIGLVAVILIQKTSSDGFTGASSPSAFLTGRAQANLFTRITSIFATLFILNSLVLAYMASHSERGAGIIDKITKAKEVVEKKAEKKSEKIIKVIKEKDKKDPEKILDKKQEKPEEKSSVPISE